MGTKQFKIGTRVVVVVDGEGAREGQFGILIRQEVPSYGGSLPYLVLIEEEGDRWVQDVRAAPEASPVEVDQLRWDLSVARGEVARLRAAVHALMGS